MAMYSVEYKGFVVPGYLRRNPFPNNTARGEENWATLLAVKGYVKGASILDFIPANPSEAIPGETAFNSVGSPHNTVFKCPSGVELGWKENDPNHQPTSKTDGRNSFYWRRQSVTSSGLAGRGTAPMVDNFYAFNGVVPTVAEIQANTGQAPPFFPMRTLDYSNAAATLGRIMGTLTKTTQIRGSSTMAMIFDGVMCHDLKTNRISSRHGKKTVTMCCSPTAMPRPCVGLLPIGDDAATSELRDNSLVPRTVSAVAAGSELITRYRPTSNRRKRRSQVNRRTPRAFARGVLCIAIVLRPANRSWLIDRIR